MMTTHFALQIKYLDSTFSVKLDSEKAMNIGFDSNAHMSGS